MTAPVDSAAGVYNDFAGLAALKKSARSNDPEALRQVAKQYESLFARMMIKSMRDAAGKDPLFGSDEARSYQEMYDDQLSIEMTKGRGLGLADMLVRQLQRLSGGTGSGTGQTDSKAEATQGSGSSGAQAASGSASTGPGGRTGAGSPLRMYGSATTTAAQVASPQTQVNFISELWPTAQEAGQQLGVDPRNLIAQAALETDWGTRVPRDASGRSSNNLFGMKAGGQWSGASVLAGTQEYRNGGAVSTTGQFRAYDNRAQSFQDYVSLLRGNPRYAAALNTGGDTQAFASALQRGGYATDPQYARKITAIAATVCSHGGTLEASLKSASTRPINPNTGIL
jgi:peptidoglycan hydrolase FlgJ